MNRRGFFRSLGIAALGAAARVYAPAVLDKVEVPEVIYRTHYSWAGLTDGVNALRESIRNAHFCGALSGYTSMRKEVRE